MEENKKQEKPKSEWQKTKESWYDKIPLTVKQLDIIIWACLGGLAFIFIKAFVESGRF